MWVVSSKLRASRRGFLLLSLSTVGCLTSADAGIIEYELVGVAVRHSNVMVPNESRIAFVEAIRSFGADHQFKIVVVPGPNKDQIAIELTSDRFVLRADNPFRDAKEYHIALYQEDAKSVVEGEVDKYWSELKRKLMSVNGVEQWLDK
jgi:hypothetical protein